MKARDLVALCDTGEPSILQRLYGISTRQAEALEVHARRLVRDGQGDQELAHERMIATRSHAPTEALEEIPEPTDSIEDEAQARARRIKAESLGLQQSSVASMRSQLAVCERNMRAGYSEWSGMARVL